MKPEYNADVFDVKDFFEARNIILTPEDGATTDQRWKKETPHIVELICDNFAIDEKSSVLDFGCGIGRISKSLIEKTGCRVVGVDISASMRAIAASYVNDHRFFACHPAMLEEHIFAFDYAISIWVLQHVENPELELKRIRSEGCPLFVVNEAAVKGHSDRVVPFKGGWYNDGIPLRAEIEKLFKLKREGKLQAGAVPQSQAERTYWAVYD